MNIFPKKSQNFSSWGGCSSPRPPPLSWYMYAKLMLMTDANVNSGFCFIDTLKLTVSHSASHSVFCYIYSMPAQNVKKLFV